MRTGRVTRVAEFGAFVELEPGIEGLAHVSTFPPTGRRDGWTAPVPVGLTAAFEILSIDLAQKRIGVALVEEGTSRAASASLGSGRHRARRDRHRQGRAARELRRVRVPRAGAHRPDAVLRDRPRSRRRHAEGVSRSAATSRSRCSRSSRRPADPRQQEGGGAAARAGRAARVPDAGGRGAVGSSDRSPTSCAARSASADETGDRLRLGELPSATLTMPAGARSLRLTRWVGWIRLVSGLAAVFALFQWSAAALGSDRGQAGMAIGALIVAVVCVVERLLFGVPFRSPRAGTRPRRGRSVAA